MSQHTPEPWSINEWPQANADISIGAIGTPLIARVPFRDVSINEQKANARRIVACVTACAGIETERLEKLPSQLFAEWCMIVPEPPTTYADLENQRDALRQLLFDLLSELGERDRGDGNAPGHCHEVPGIWDADNGKLAGKPCAWCAVWNKAKELRGAV